MNFKKCFFVFFLSMSIIGYSQSSKGDMSISITASPLTQANTANLGLIGKVGLEFFISSNVSVQGNFFASNSNVIKDDNGFNINSYGVLPTIQYYFTNKEKFNLFGQLGYGFGFDDETRNFGVIENSALRVYSIGAGMNYKLNDKLQLQLLLPYFNAKNMTVNEVSATGITAFLGFNFLL